jgi:hypothetical protein
VRTTKFGGFLLAIGATVGVAGVIGLVIGFEPARLPPALLNVAAYKLTFAAAAALLATGAIVLRHSKRDRASTQEPAALSAMDGPSPAGLGSPPIETDLLQRRDPAAEKVAKPR